MWDKIEDKLNANRESELFMPKEKLIAEMTPEEKRKKAQEICDDFDRTYFPHDFAKACQDDFKMCSLVAYKLIEEYYGPAEKRTHDAERIPLLWGNKYFRNGDPICGESWLPVRYCGGNMEFGRVFSINHCAFSSRDSIVGFANPDGNWPVSGMKILKGLKFYTQHDIWTLMKLNPDSTDDMSGMLFLPLEKNFTIEFAHFPHEGGRRTLFRWVDS